MTKGKYPIGYYEYRDDRRYVINLHPMRGGRWALLTYRNTGSLPQVREDEFDSYEEAVDYVKRWEPAVPLESLNGGQPVLSDYGSFDEDDVSAKHEAFTRWLEDRGLFSTLKRYRHVPYFLDMRGWTEKRATTAVSRRKIVVDGVKLYETETKFPITEL